MGRPWSYPPTKADLRAAAGILVNLSQGKSTRELCNAIAPGDVDPIPHGPLFPDAVVNVTEDYLLVAINGTQNYLQWVCHFLGSNQTTRTPYPGQVNDFFSLAANSLGDALVAYEGLLETHRLIVIGHSFGAAIGQLLSVRWQNMATRGVVTICFGCPRVGNPEFADGATYPAFRVQAVDDPVPSFPPERWVGTGTPWTGFVGLVPATYMHGGVAKQLAANGVLSDNDATMGFSAATNVVAAQKFTPHYIEEYLRRLSIQADPPLPEWEDPGQVEGALDWEADTFAPEFPNNQGGPMAITQGIMYFRSLEESAGWGESWVGDTDITAMLAKLKALAPVRAGCLSSSIVIDAVKAANIDPARVANASRSELLDNPIPGKASGTSIKDVASTLTNETMDAIDYEVTSVANASRRVFPFRGVPDFWIVGSKRSGDGIGAEKKFQSYFAAVKAATLGFKVYDRTKPKTPITKMELDAVTSLLKVTSAGHGLQDRQLIQIRAYDPNPMLNGTWRVKVPDANTFLLVGSQRFNAASNGVGTWQLKNIVTDQIEAAFFNSCSTRKVGRPFGQRRGKRSARILHH